jgi:glycosyltransferase involved in cell wall biosynthesis
MNSTKILLIFPEEHLSYSPTTLNVFRELQKHYETTVITFAPSKRSKKRIEDKGVIFIETPTWHRYFLKPLLIIHSLFQKKTNYKLLKKIGLSSFYRLFLLKTQVKPFIKSHEIIAIDFISAWLCQEVFDKKIHYLSLEIFEGDPFFMMIDNSKLKSVFIQNEDRYNFIFKHKQLNTFYIQNAPEYIPFKTLSANERKGLLFLGSAEIGFGIYSCLDFIKQYPEFTLTIKGPMLNDVKETIHSKYGDLISKQRLIIDSNYIEQSELASYLNKFRIGFCFYDTRQPKMDRFNYYTAPSGKLFQYHASGIPVIASDLPGLNSVRNYHTGVMIPNLTPETIYQAIQTIEANYDIMVENSFVAADFYDFTKSIKPYVEVFKQVE